ncbi:MAG: hypothetical protein ACM3ZV_00075 [Bacillota bacterium]
MKHTTPKHSKAKLPRGRKKGRQDDGESNQATTRDFEREEMGIAPKE